jgi:hypothetical protein
MDVTPSSLVSVYRCFGETCCLLLQGQSIGQARTKQVSFYLPRLLFNPEGDSTSIRNVVNIYHITRHQKIVISIVTAVKTYNLMVKSLCVP